jgi:hypothetical protein
MGRLESRLGAAEETLIDELILEVMVEAEIREMLRVLEASEAIERPLYEKVAHIITTARDERWSA